MSEVVIRQVTKAVWSFSKPFKGLVVVPLGGRTTAIKLEPSGDVWVVASTPLTPETRDGINAIGPVKYIMAANASHSTYLAEFKSEYPNAKLIGVEPLLKKTTLQFDGAYGSDPEGTKYGFESEIDSCYFSGATNKDVAWFHIPSRTLIQGDLLLNLPSTEQYSKSTAYGRIPFVTNLLSPYTYFHKGYAWISGANREVMKREVKTVAEWDFERIIPCHGNVIEKDGKKAWLAAYKWYLE